MPKIVLFFLSILPLFMLGQQWEMQTPIKLGDFATDAFVVDDTTAYACTLNGKLYKTTNTGTHWTEAHNVIGYPSMGTVWGIHFTNINTGYMSEGNGRIYKTNDAANTWNEVYNNNALTLYEIYFPSTDTGYACGYPGTVLKTIDAGQNWITQTTNNSQELRDIWFIDNITGCAVTDQGDIFKTIDGGSNWNPVSTGHPALTDISFFDSNNGIVVGGTGTILITTDGGSNWSLVPSGTTKWLSAVSYVNSNEVLVAGNDGTILRSVNGGNNYLSEGPNTTFDNFNGFAIFSNGAEIVVGDGTMYYRNFVAGTWDMKYDEIIESNLNRVIFTDSDYGYVVGNGETLNGGASGIIQSKNGGKLWTTRLYQVGSGTGLYDVHFPETNQGFAAGSNYIKNTTDSGNTQWSTLTNNVPSGANTAIYFTNQNIGFLSNSVGIYKTTDAGLNWTLKRNGPNMERFYFIDSDTGYVCGPGATIFKTIDAGESWFNLTTPAVTGTFRSIHFANNSTGYVVGDGGYKTTDYGNTWSSLSGFSSAYDVYFPDSLNPDSGFVLLRSGEIKKTVDGGNNWTTAVSAPFDKDFNAFWFEGDYIHACGTWGDMFKVNINPQPPVADFLANNTSITPGSTVDFTDLSTMEPNFWEWSFAGAIQSGSSTQHPTGIRYDTLGCFEVTLRVVNNFGEDTITKSCYINVIPNNYCTPNLTNGTIGGDFIDGVHLGNINNINTGSTTGSSYFDYTDMITTIEQNGNYDLEITGGDWNPDEYAAWIDYNMNGIFESNEKLGEFSTTANFQTQTINFTVPMGANVGNTRLRVYGAYNAVNMDPCTDYIWGEIEDYTVTINSMITNINKESFEGNLMLYPNPTSTSLTINTQLNIDKLIIKDITGKTITSINLKSNVIDVSSLSNGIYFIKIEAEGQIIVRKFIKN